MVTCLCKGSTLSMLMCFAIHTRVLVCVCLHLGHTPRHHVGTAAATSISLGWETPCGYETTPRSSRGPTRTSSLCLEVYWICLAHGRMEKGNSKEPYKGGAKKLTGVHRGWAVKGRAGGWTRVVQQLNCLVTKLQKDSNLFSFN